MKLYYTPGACSLASHIVACEAGLPLEYDRVDLKTQTTASGLPFAKINKGDVPALALRAGEVLTESSAVLQYLADLAPHARLLPEPGSIDRYRVLEWLGFIGTELHNGFAPLWKPGSTGEARSLAATHLHRRFAHLDQSLRARSYLVAERFTIADAYCFAILSWTRFHRLDVSAYPAVNAFMKRVATRASVQQALLSEGLLHLAQAWTEA